MCDRCTGHRFEEEDCDDNPWVELAQQGLTREDQIPDMKDWLARRQASLDQYKKMYEEQYVMRHPMMNRFRMDYLEAWQFRIEIDRWQLEQFIAGLEETRENHGF